MEKISIAVNNYFSSLESGEIPDSEAALPEEPTDTQTEADIAPETNVGLDGDFPVAPRDVDQSGAAPVSGSEAEELYETGQAFEGDITAGVENAPPADEAEVEVDSSHPGEDDIPREKQ